MSGDQSGRLLDRAARTRGALLAHMRHELRTPVNAIIGYSELLLEDAPPEAPENFRPDLEKIHSAGRQLLTSLNRFLDPATLDVNATTADLEAFAAAIHHEVRTPINAIIGYGEMLIEDAHRSLDESVVGDLGRIRAAALGMLALIDDIIDLSRTESAPVKQEIDWGAVPSMIKEVVTSLDPLNQSTARGGAGGYLLVVEDNETNRDILSRRLKRDGHRVAVAENGLKALDLLSREGFDLVLLDVMMPEMNGYQVLERMKGDKRLRDIPVLVISALDDIDSAVRCIEMGADDYLPKPFNPVLLKARIGASLEKKRLRDQEHIYTEQLRIEREKSERLLLNILPRKIVEQLKESHDVIAESFDEATVLFADLVGFTELSAQVAPSELVYMLNEIFSCFDHLAERHGLEKIKTIGDAYMAAAGLPVRRPDHAEATAEMSLDMREEIARINRQKDSTLSLRIGIHTGPVIAGIIGAKKFIYDLWGDTVNTASRMESHGIAGQVQVSASTFHRLEEKYLFEPRGLIQVKGKGEMYTYFLTGRNAG